MYHRCACLLFAISLAVASSRPHGSQGRTLARLVGQQPLLFGRRGVNPNMNSLFFGKRSPQHLPSPLAPSLPSAPQAPLQPSLNDLRAACGVLLTSYQQVMMDDAQS